MDTESSLCAGHSFPYTIYLILNISNTTNNWEGYMVIIPCFLMLPLRIREAMSVT